VKVFIELPVLNEIENIAELLDRIDTALAGTPYVVCVVDDGSRDGTREYLRERRDRTPETLAVIERTKTQHGSQRGGALYAALEYGLERTDCDVFVEIDGDLSHRPEELPAALAALDEGSADIVIASKFVEGSEVINRPVGRELVSVVCSWAVHIFLSRSVQDYSNGYRFYTRRAAELIAQTRIRYTSPIYLSEVLAIWLRAGLRVREIPTVYVGRGDGLSKLRLVDLAKASLAVLEISLRYHVTGFRRR
jgi:dolichol-phosphate mannosyltransferase